MREMGVSGVVVYCRDFQCSHHVAISADRWPDHVRLSDVEPLFVCCCRSISRETSLWKSLSRGSNCRGRMP
jgi:hypothetical protein